MGKIETYEKMTDDELFQEMEKGNSEITDFLIDKYKYLVRNKAQTMFILGADRDDLIQEGMIGLFKAIRDYDRMSEASFFTFADLCVSRQIYTAIQAAGRLKHSPLNSYISLNGSYGEEDSGNQATLDRMSFEGKDGLNPEDIFIAKENQMHMTEQIKKELSNFEWKVFQLYRLGMNYQEIANTLDKDPKSTDNAIQRIKKKVKKIIAFDN